MFLLALAPLAACSQPEVDTPSVEQRIERQIGRQVHDTVTVHCPDGVKWQTGGDFHCFARDSGGNQERITVSMETDGGAYSWQVG